MFSETVSMGVLLVVSLPRRVAVGMPEGMPAPFRAVVGGGSRQTNRKELPW